MCDTVGQSDPKMAEETGLVSGGQASHSTSSPEMAEMTHAEEGLPGPALTPSSPGKALCRPCCLVLLLILLLLSFLGSWAVVHLSLGARGKPFRISSSYDQPGEQETATYDPLFITNCSMGKRPVLAVCVLVFKAARNVSSGFEARKLVMGVNAQLMYKYTKVILDHENRSIHH